MASEAPKSLSARDASAEPAYGGTHGGDGEPAALRDLSERVPDSDSLNWASESRLMLFLALPSVIVQANIFWIWLYNASFAGRRLGVTEMAGVSTANLAGNLTAMSIQYGLIFALESLTSQAMGGHRYHEVGLLVQRCVVCCMIALIPGYLLWAYMEDLLILLHQPPEVAALAARFLHIYAPGLPGLVLFELSRRFLGCQDIIMAYIPISALATWVCHPLLLWRLHEAGFGFDSVPIASASTMWILALLTLCYIVVFKPHDPRTWEGLDVRHTLSHHGMAQFLRIAVPGIFTMSEWWFWEVIAACIGALGEVPLASHLIAYAIVPMLVMAPIGVSIAIAVRVGQLIGEERPRHAKMVARSTFAAGIVIIASYTLAVALNSSKIIRFFANEQTSEEVVRMTHEIWPLVCGFLVVDGMYMVLNGIIRALAFQFRASICVIVSLWVVGLPATLWVAFSTDAGLRGVWAMLLPVYALLNILCALIVLCANWSHVSAEVTEVAREDDALAEEQLAQERLEEERLEQLELERAAAERFAGELSAEKDPAHACCSRQ